MSGRMAAGLVGVALLLLLACTPAGGAPPSGDAAAGGQRPAAAAPPAATGAPSAEPVPGAAGDEAGLRVRQRRGHPAVDRSRPGHLRPLRPGRGARSAPEQRPDRPGHGRGRDRRGAHGRCGHRRHRPGGRRDHARRRADELDALLPAFPAELRRVEGPARPAGGDHPVGLGRALATTGSRARGAGGGAGRDADPGRHRRAVLGSLASGSADAAMLVLPANLLAERQGFPLLADLRDYQVPYVAAALAATRATLANRPARSATSCAPTSRRWAWRGGNRPSPSG